MPDRPYSRRYTKRPVRHSLPLVSLWLGLVGLVGGLLWLTGSTSTGLSSSGERPPADFTAGQTPVTIPLNSGPSVVAIKPNLTLPPLARPAAPTATPAPVGVSFEAFMLGNLDKWKGSLGKGAELGLIIRNLDSGDKVQINPQQVFETASLYKLFVMLTVYYDISQGKMSLDDQITLSPAAAEGVADDGGALIIPIGQSMAVRDLLNAMITDSNNVAALMLLFQVRTAHMRQVVADMGFKGANLTDSYNFRATPEDFDQFFDRLDDQKLLGSKYDLAMIEVLSRVNTRDRIPALLPPDTHTAHKTGNFGTVVHDTGLVWLPKGGRLAVTVMTRETDPLAARKFIAQLTLATYDFFNSR